MPCVSFNEHEDSFVFFHGDHFFEENHDSSVDNVNEVFGAFEIKRFPRFGPTVGREGVFLRRRVRWNESGFSYRPSLKRVDALVETLSLEGASLVATNFNHSHVTLESVKPTICAG